MARNCCGCDRVDSAAAWCMTVYTTVRTALIRYCYSPTSQHWLQEEAKELPPLDLELFFWYLLVWFRWSGLHWSSLSSNNFAVIVGHSHSRTRSAMSTVLNTIPTTDNGHHSPHCSRANTMVSWWRQDADGVVWKVAWWPTPLAHIGEPVHLSRGVALPHWSYNRHCIGGSRCCRHHVQAQIDIVSVRQCIWHSSMTNRLSTLIDRWQEFHRSSSFIVQMSATQLTVITFIYQATILLRSAVCFFLLFCDRWQIST